MVPGIPGVPAPVVAPKLISGALRVVCRARHLPRPRGTGRKMPMGQISVARPMHWPAQCDLRGAEHRLPRSPSSAASRNGPMGQINVAWAMHWPAECDLRQHRRGLTLHAKPEKAQKDDQSRRIQLNRFLCLLETTVRLLLHRFQASREDGER